MRTRAIAERQGFFSSQSGITLLELTVVSAILAVLAGIIAFSVSGQSTQSRNAVQLIDISEVQKATDTFAGRHPQGRYPTLNGCLPGGGLVLDLVALKCVTVNDLLDPGQINVSNLEFVVIEADVGIDINGDGDTSDSVVVAPIIWAKGFKDDSGTIRRMSGDFIQRDPKHAFEFFDGNDPEGSWQDGIALDPDGLGNINTTTITSPEGLGAGNNRINASLRQYPVWVVTSSGIVLNLLPSTRY